MKLKTPIKSSARRPARQNGARLVNRKLVQSYCDAVAQEFRPQKIILFGSHAYGTPHEGSDIDLLVIMPYEGGHAQQAIKILNTIGGFAPPDLLVRTPDEVAKRIEMGDFFMREITEQGKVLYEATHN